MVMAFFRQLQLLLWKNGLGIIRRPFWSVTLIVWPIIIFIIIAVTRYQFPPILRQTCYVGPRNLPSTGFFPFLETLMCNTDSSCHNTTRLAYSSPSNQPSRNKRSPEVSPLSTLLKSQELSQFTNNTDQDPSELLNLLDSIFGSSSGQPGSAINATFMGDQPTINLTESAAKLKTVICTLSLPLVNTSSSDHFAVSLVTFCRSNSTVFEVAINTLNSVLIELMTSQPEELAKWAEKGVNFFDQLQNKSSLWESFTALPQIFHPTSPDQFLTNMEKLLTSLQTVLNVAEQSFPEIKANMSSVHPFLVAGISLTRYMLNWPGKSVSIRFGDVVQNETVWQMVSNIEISLDKAIALTFDREMVRDYVCKNSTNPMLMAACATGTLDMFLGWICPKKLSQQTLLAWSKYVASHDLSFVKGLLHSLGGFGSSATTKTARSIETQPQNIEEELFLEVGKVVIEILQLSPEADAIVQQILRFGYQSMKIATQSVMNVEEIMDNVMKDATTVRMILHTLMTNQSQTTIWLNDALNSVSEVVVKVLAGEPLTCEIVLGHFDWLFSIKSIKLEVWRSFICGNSSTTEQTLLKDWMPLMENAQELSRVFQGSADYNVTLLMILSEWHELFNKSQHFGVFLEQLVKEWGGAYWMDWMSGNCSAHHVTTSLQQSLSLFMVNLGQKFEQSSLWPKAKSYFLMANWILNYSACVTTQPNCSMNVANLGIECDTPFNWYQFVEAVTKVLLSPSEEVLISCVKGSVQLLQHVYGDFYKQQAAAYLNKTIEGGDMLSAFLVNLLNQLTDFTLTLTTLPNESFSNFYIMVPLYQKLLESTGLKPLLPLIFSDGPVNISQVLEVASQLGRSNQGIFTFNESDPTMAELEQHIMQFLSMEGNLSMSLYLSMSHTLLTYSNYFSPEYVAKVREAIQPFTNQTSAGIVEAILRAVELLKTIMDAPNGDPTQIIFGYIRQLQEFLVSLFRMQRIEQIMLPNGQFSPAQITDLQLLSDIFNLLTPETIMNLTQAEPEAAQLMIIQKYIETLPAQLRPEAAEFLKKFVALQSQLAQCDSGQNCLTGISEILNFLDQILEMTLNTNGNVTINIAATNTYLGRKEYEPVAFAFFSLILPSDDAAYVKMVQETLQFISLLIRQPNITVSDIQEALKQTNLTIEEINYLVTQLGATDLNDLIEKIIKLFEAQQCFEQNTSPELTAYCAVVLVDSLSGFLTRFPSLQNETSILSLLPIIVNKTITNMINTNFSTPQNALADALNATLANIKMTLQLNNLSTPEIMNEIKVLESLIKLVVNHEPLNRLNITMNEFNVGDAQLKIVLWYLERLENATSGSSFSNLLYPFFRITQMQVALQLAQLDLNNFISEQILNLTNSLQYPIDEDGVSKIGQVTIAILQHVVKFAVLNVEAQNAPAFIFGYDPPINMTVVNATVLQINNYIKLIQQWMNQSNLVAWGNSSNTLSITVNDIFHLLQSTLHFFNNDQQDYFYAIGNITQALNKALMVAEQSNGLQSDSFLAALLEAVQSALQLVTRETGPLPPSVQQSILEVVKNTVWLAVHSEMSYAQSLNTTLYILQNLEFIIKQTASEEVAQYLLAALKVAATYFQSVSTANGPDNWNQIILNEMKTLESLLPPNCTAHFYISTIINITQFILQPVQGNTSLWTQGASQEIVPLILAEVGKFLNIFWPFFTGGSGSALNASSVSGFADLPVILEEVMTGKANNETWTKLQTMVEILLTSFAEPQMPEYLACFVELFEKTIGGEVKARKAENDLIVGLQIPVMTLVTEITRSLNGSHLNMSEISESLELAIGNTLKAFDQTNGSLNCQEALKYWEPVREAAGLSQSTVAMWCSVNLQPVIDDYVNSLSQYAQQNWSCTEMGPVAIDAAAARIVESVRSLYNTEVNQSHVIDQFVEAFYNQLSALVDQPLSLQAKLNLYKQIQAMQIQSSLKSIQLLSQELGNNFPFLKPYMEAVEKTLVHIVKNAQETEGMSEEFFNEAATILLYSLNITSNDIYYMMSGNYSSEAWVEMVKKALQTLIDMKVFGEDPVLYQTFEKFLASNGTKMIIQKLTELFSWFTSTQAQGFDLLIQALTKIQELLSPLLSALSHMDVDLPPNLQLLNNLTSNMISVIRQALTTGGFSTDNQYSTMSQPTSSLNGTRARRRREAVFMPVRGPMDDFIDLFSINYHSMFQGLMEPPTTSEIAETVHVFFANPDLGTVMKGATKDVAWGLESSREQTIDAALGVASLLTVPGTEFSSLELWMNAINMLPDGFPYASLLKNVTRALAMETPENLTLMQETLRTLSALLQSSPTDPRFTEQLKQLNDQVCNLEKTDPIQMLVRGLSLEPGVLCNGLVPGLQILAEGLLLNTSTLVNNIFEVFIGDPRLYNLNTNWTSLMTNSFGLDINALRALNLTSTAPGVVTIGEMVRNKTAFMLDLQKLGFDPAVVYLLTEAALPDNNVQILSWLLNLRRCNSTDLSNMGEGEKVLFESFCSMSAEQWYSFLVLMAQHLNTEKFIYRMVLPGEIQSLVQTMLRVAETVINMMKDMLPAVRQLEEYLISIESLSLAANNDFHQLSRSQKSSISSQATFVTISRALCSQGILAIFGVAKNPTLSVSPPTFTDSSQREEMIERFKIPRDATPFCTNMYLDMVNTTGGAIAWAFLKPMLMGKILFSPDTPQTRAIMNKANSTLQQLADLRYYSQDWIKSSDYIMKSSEMLSQTLPLLQNSLGNSFVKNFIEMQTGINIGTMQETLNSFSNMTLLLEKNKELLGQITTLSTLMVDLSSCIKFDRYQGYDTEVELNSMAQELAKNRDLYASVIFKLPEDSHSSRKRRAASDTTTLPPKVHYTIRMHMDNVMRTDRVREPYFVKDNHISARQTLRYNRGFIYLQETIDRAIIEIQSNQKVTDTAVQIQPFPYPCYMRDEYLEAISFVFPLLLMIAWVLFVADFVKKLVHEREMKLHEYMKMMGVSPLSHFFAWFLESAAYLVLTIFLLTLVLKYGLILPRSNGFLLFLYLCVYGLSVLGFSFLVSSLFNKTYIAALSGSLLYVLCFFPFIVVMAMESTLSFSQKSLLGLFSPSAFSYASQYVSRYETQGEGIQWSNSYTSPLAGDTASFGWLCWLMLIDAILYFIIGAYIRMVFPGESGIPYPWYFPFKASFWTDLCGCKKIKSTGRGLFFSNIMQTQQSVFPDSKGKGKGDLSSKAGEDFSDLPVGVALYGLTKIYGQQVAIENLNVAFYEGHVTSLLGHNGAGKTTTMSILTGLFPPSSGTVEVYGRDMQVNLEDVRKELGVCMQYDVLFDHMTAKEHLLLYGQIKAPHWSKRELHEQVRTILGETGMYSHRHKRVGTLSGGMKRKLSISIAFIGGSRLVVLDEPTTGVDPCSRRSIWDIVIQHKKGRTIIMSTHHLDEAEVLSDRIAFLERGGLKCCGSPFHLKDQLGQGYKLTLTKKMHNGEATEVDNAELKAFVQAHVPEARLKEAQGSDLVYLLPPFSSSNASSYRSLLTALDSNLDALQLGCYGISDTTLEEVFLHLTHDTDSAGDGAVPTISETVSDTDSINSYPDSDGSTSNFGDKICVTGTPSVSGVKLAWQQMTAILIKRFHHSRRDWKGLISQIVLPVLFVVCAMGLGNIKNDLRNYPELELSPALYSIGPSYSFFSDQNSSKLADTMLSFPGLDNTCLQKSNDQVCTRSTAAWSAANATKKFGPCKCVRKKEVCGARDYVPPHKQIPSSQIVYNLTGHNVENYLVATADEYIRNRYGGFDFGLPLPPNLKMDVKNVPQNRTLSKVWFNPEGHHTMPAYLNSLNNFILRSNLPADKDPSQYAISVSSHPYFGRPDDEDAIVQGMLQILVAICVLAGYSITTASFAIYEVNEHHSGSKRLQHIAGVSEPFYWAVNFFYDMVIYMIPVALTVGVIAAFQIPAFTERQNLGAVTLLLVLFGFSTFPWMYLLSSVFKDTEMAFISYVCINLFLSVNTIIPTSILYFMRQITQQNAESLKVIFDRLSYAFLIFPQFNFGNGLLELARMNIEVQILSGYGIDAYKNPFSTEALGWMFISSFILGLFFFSLRLLLNKFIIRKIRRLVLRGKAVPLVPCVDEDDDVAAEHLRVSTGAASSDVLQVHQLTKVYQHLNKKVPAVQRLSLGVPAGECFGLLGVNGAGKTTTFKMLTGDVCPSDGTAQIRDKDGRLVDIMECRNQGINIGYCPQEDALDDLLTGEEHLQFYASLHGISKREIPGVVNYLLRKLELNYYRSITTNGYSCGTRRKLSTALALVGHPQILLLDEPSSGMDPRTKRHLWKIISDEVKGKCAVVLTSHSMEECEALCGRLAIMVKGQFRCLGSLQHIKNRFGSGFTVKMYLAKASSDAEAITRFMQSRFPSTYLKEQHSSMVEYHVPVAPGGVADIFGQLESSKEYLEIQHFSVSQTTLDEVFINFAMGKIEMETIPIDDEFDDDSSMKDVEA